MGFEKKTFFKSRIGEREMTRGVRAATHKVYYAKAISSEPKIKRHHYRDQWCCWTYHN